MTEICCVCEDPIVGEIIWAEGDLPFCEKCAGKELVECDYCGDLRWPENLLEYCGKNPDYKNKMMCIGCIEEVDDECVE